MIDLAHFRGVVHRVIDDFGSTDILVYKYVTPNAADVDIYTEQAPVEYMAPVAMQGVYLKEVDKDIREAIGGKNHDEARFTFSIPHLEAAFPEAAYAEWITKKDVIECEGDKYTLSGVHYYGRASPGGASVLQVRGTEFNDAILVRS